MSLSKAWLRNGRHGAHLDPILRIEAHEGRGHFRLRRPEDLLVLWPPPWRYTPVRGGRTGLSAQVVRQVGRPQSIQRLRFT
jgi:hypothetical protein